MEHRRQADRNRPRKEVAFWFYWDDLKAGDRRTLNRRMTESDIVNFVGVKDI
jgi:hypothetical protein